MRCGACIFGLTCLAACPATAEQLGAQERQRLLQIVAEGDTGQQDQAAQRIYYAGDTLAGKRLLRLALHPKAEMRVRALRALSVVRPPGTAKVLQLAMVDPSVAVSLTAIEVTPVFYPTRQALSLLQPPLRDKRNAVRRAVVRALTRLGSPAVDSLWRVARRSAGDTCLIAVAALARISHRSATRRLRQLAKIGLRSASASLEKVGMVAAAHLAAPALRRRWLARYAILGRRLATAQQAVAQLARPANVCVSSAKLEALRRVRRHAHLVQVRRTAARQFSRWRRSVSTDCRQYHQREAQR